MKEHVTRLLLATVFLAPASVAFAQNIPLDTAEYVAIRTTDGNEFVGQVLARDSTTVVLKTDMFSEIAIQRAFIRRMIPVAPGQASSNLYWFEVPVSANYFVGPTAYGLRKGEGYYHNGLVFWNQVAFGLSDRFSISVGSIPLLAFDEVLPIWVQPKFSFPIVENKVTFGLSGILGRSFSTYEIDDFALGGVLGQVTIGTRNTNVTVGLGTAWGDGKWSKGAVASMGGVLRTGTRFAVLTENYFFRSYGYPAAINMSGFRIIGRRVSFDFGLLSYIEELEIEGALPWLALYATIGRRR